MRASILIFVFLAAGCSDFILSSEEVNTDWRKSVEKLLSVKTSKIEELRVQCKGEFTVRYKLDDFFGEFNMPVFWECKEKR